MRTPEVNANQTDNGKRKGANTNEQRRRRNTIYSRASTPQGCRQGTKEIQSSVVEQAATLSMAGFRTASFNARALTNQ
eukprot:9681515-Heterocapsa_arctica.AAC.1